MSDGQREEHDTAESDQQISRTSQDLLICVFIHGFKGTESTFGDFPSRLRHILDASITNIRCECVVFPAYETKGELNQATERFADWLTTLTVEREVSQGRGGGAGKARIILCAHSMGGLVAADTCLNLAKWRADQTAPLWPNVIACVCFDTPFLGLHPWVFRGQASKALQFVDVAHGVASSLGFFGAKAATPKPTPPSPKGLLPAPEAAPSEASSSRPWTRYLTPTTGYAVGGVLLATAAAGTAYYRRQDIENSVNWAQDHMKYVGNLWSEQELRDRLDKLMNLSKSKANGGEGILFRNFYTLLPPKGSDHPQTRTFIILPDPTKQSEKTLAQYFLAAVNNRGDDEISAHTGMFDAKTNDGYYELGLGVVEIIRRALGETPLSSSQADLVEGDIKDATSVDKDDK